MAEGESGPVRSAELVRMFGVPQPQPTDGSHMPAAGVDTAPAAADIAVAKMSGQIVGVIELVFGSEEERRARVSVIAVRAGFRRRGIGRVLLSRALARARQQGMRALDWVLPAEDAAAQDFAMSAGFVPFGSEGMRLTMSAALPAVELPKPATPLEEHARLAAALDLAIDLRLKRDDLYPMPGGGIKARKIQYIMREAIARGHDVIVTNGGPQSNHARAAAVLSAELGVRCHLVIVLEPGVVYPGTGNILLMRLSGATIEFCRKEQLAERMDATIEEFCRRGHKPLYVWGGGHCLAGTVAFVEAAAEARAQGGVWVPDVLVAASATGSTQAGLAIGYADSRARVIGISTARDAARQRKCGRPGAEPRVGDDPRSG